MITLGFFSYPQALLCYIFAGKWGKPEGNTTTTRA